MVALDDRWIDVDFEEEARKAGRLLGSTERTGKFGCPLFGDRVPVMTWQEIDAAIDAIDAAGGGLDNFKPYQHDQNGEPSCTSNATCSALEYAMQITLGTCVPLSPISLYRRVGSRNSGSSVDDNLDEATRVGILPLDCAINRERGISGLHPHNGYGVSPPSNWQTIAGEFRAQEVFDIRSSQEFFTSLCRGWPVVYGRQGHCIICVRPMRSGGNRKGKYLNSWGNWGDNGFGYDTANQISMGAGWAFAVRSVVMSPTLRKLASIAA